MPTTVHVVACKVLPNSSSNNLNQQCPSTQRTVVTTTIEQLTNTTTTVIGTQPFDYAYASSIWSLAFTSVVGLYLVSKNVGLILALIKGR
jgi:hypothetical protein